MSVELKVKKVEREKPRSCPVCRSIFVDWDEVQQTYRCLVRECRYTFREKSEIEVRKVFEYK